MYGMSNIDEEDSILMSCVGGTRENIERRIVSADLHHVDEMDRSGNQEH
jgi:hypothetical protein